MSRVLGWLLVTTAACTPTVERSARPGASVAAASPKAASAPPPQYVLKPPPLSNVGRVLDLGDGTRGMLVGPRRALFDPKGGLPKLAEDDISVSRAMALGPGDGFLFFTGVGLSRAKGFIDPMEPVVTGSIDDAWVGPGFVLVRKSSGETVAVDLAGDRPKRSLPIGLAVVATSPKLAIGLAHGGRTHRSTDGGATWTDVSNELTWAPTNVVVDGGAVVVSSSQLGIAARAEANRFVPAPVPRPPPPQSPPGWTSTVSPIEIAVARGAPFGDDRVIVADSGSVFVISSRTGAILEREGGVLPPDRPCDTLSMSDGALFVCPSHQGAAVFRRGKSDKRTALERTFTSTALFHRGAGDSLLFAGPCSGQPRLAAACVRHADGSWHDLERPELRDNPQGTTVTVLSWIPDGEHALIVLGAPGGGIIDTKTGARSKLEDAEANLLSSHLRVSASTLVDRFAVDEAGEIVGFGAQNVGVKVARTGKDLVVSPFRFGSAGAARGRVLASQNDKIWQSDDWGFTFQEVAPPPLPTSSTTPVCSAAGCALYEWLRIGWEARPPTDPGSRRHPVGLSPPPDEIGPRPALRCSSSGETARKLASPRGGQERVGFGAEMLKVTDTSYFAAFPRGLVGGTMGTTEAGNLRAFVTGTRPDITADGAVSTAAAPRRVRTLVPFDPKGATLSATFRVTELLDAARAVGGAVPDLSQSDERGYSVTVAGDPPSVLLGGVAGPLLWIRQKGGPVPLSLGADISDGVVVSAVQTGPDEVAVLLEDYVGATTVRRLAKGKAEAAFTLPPWPDPSPPITPDALAIGPGDKLAVIRVPTRTPPTADQPALLLTPGAAPARLAPWSTVAADGSPECASMTGWRAVIAMPAPWFRSGVDTDDGADRIGFARVRWGTERICVEAVEIHANTYDLPSAEASSYLVARFGKDPAAGHLFIGDGSELREPRVCTLEPGT